MKGGGARERAELRRKGRREAGLVRHLRLHPNAVLDCCGARGVTAQEDRSL